MALMSGFNIRKNAGRGYKSDTLDYSAGPGSDLCTKVVWEDGSNMEDALAAGTAEVAASDVRMNAVPGSDSGGNVTWSRLGSIGDMVLTDTVADVGVPGFIGLALYAQAAQARKVNPMTATQIDVART